uniref:Nanos-type domain-containing protein n=2 Tax=Macrostomum lignano TaxID=282301 RepID=A0A1I8HQY1_9PLAT
AAIISDLRGYAFQFKARTDSSSGHTHSRLCSIRHFLVSRIDVHLRGFLDLGETQRTTSEMMDDDESDNYLTESEADGINDLPDPENGTDASINTSPESRKEARKSTNTWLTDHSSWKLLKPAQLSAEPLLSSLSISSNSSPDKAGHKSEAFGSSGQLGWSWSTVKPLIDFDSGCMSDSAEQNHRAPVSPAAEGWNGVCDGGGGASGIPEHQQKLFSYDAFGEAEVHRQHLLCSTLTDESRTTDESVGILLDKATLLSFLAKLKMHHQKKREIGIELCAFCRQNQEPFHVYTSHRLADINGNVTCPVLFRYVCPICGVSGSKAHTIKYCPLGNGTNQQQRHRLQSVSGF